MAPPRSGGKAETSNCRTDANNHLENKHDNGMVFLGKVTDKCMRITCTTWALNAFVTMRVHRPRAPTKASRSHGACPSKAKSKY